MKCALSHIPTHFFTSCLATKETTVPGISSPILSCTYPPSILQTLWWPLIRSYYSSFRAPCWPQDVRQGPLWPWGVVPSSQLLLNIPLSLRTWLRLPGLESIWISSYFSSLEKNQIAFIFHVSYNTSWSQLCYTTKVTLAFWSSCLHLLMPRLQACAYMPSFHSAEDSVQVLQMLGECFTQTSSGSASRRWWWQCWCKDRGQRVVLVVTHSQDSGLSCLLKLQYPLGVYQGPTEALGTEAKNYWFY